MDFEKVTSWVINEAVRDNNLSTAAEKTVFWLTKAAKQNSIEAQLLLGVLYYIGNNDISKEPKKAVYWVEKAAEQGEPLAQFFLGYLYYEGIGISKDVKNMLFWYTKAAEQGFTKAQLILGIFYIKGETVRRNTKKAIFWLTKAAEQGDDKAQFELCLYYSKNEINDFTKTIEWGTRAAEQGNTSAQLFIGTYYYVGKGIKKDIAKALSWFTKAAEKNDASAQFILGLIYFKVNDIDNAILWFKKAIKQNNIPALTYLGYCYFDGTGVEQDFNKAISLWEKAAKQGDARAQYCLGSCYYFGNGVEKNQRKATSWFTKSKDEIKTKDNKEKSVFSLFNWYHNEKYDDLKKLFSELYKENIFALAKDHIYKNTVTEVENGIFALDFAEEIIGVANRMLKENKKDKFKYTKEEGHRNYVSTSLKHAKFEKARKSKTKQELPLEDYNQLSKNNPVFKTNEPENKYFSKDNAVIIREAVEFILKNTQKRTRDRYRALFTVFCISKNINFEELSPLYDTSIINEYIKTRKKPKLYKVFLKYKPKVKKESAQAMATEMLKSFLKKLEATVKERHPEIFN